MDELGGDELICQIEASLSEEAKAIFREALDVNDNNILWALAGVCEAYVGAKRDVSAGYLRRG